MSLRVFSIPGLIFGLACAISLTTGRAPILTGSVTGRRNTTPEIQDMVNQVRSEAEFRIGTSFTDFQAIAYRGATASSNLYFVKVYVGNGRYIHLRINKPQHDAPTLEDYRVNMRRHSIIQYIAIIPQEYHSTFL